MFESNINGGTNKNDVVDLNSKLEVAEHPFSINDLDMRSKRNVGDNQNKTNIPVGFNHIEINPYDYQRDPDNLRRDPYDLQNHPYGFQPDPYAWRNTDSTNGW